VIREVFQNPGSTRFEIWEHIHGKFPPDNSSEADLFRMLIGDLSQGRIIRQQRPVNSRGQFLKKSRGTRRDGDESVILSAFDDSEPYELTELGKQFVRYVFSESSIELKTQLNLETAVETTKHTKHTKQE
jgi:hypothetical protein